MIVNMKKVTLLMGAKNKNQALESLRSLGVLHVQNITPPISEDISALQTEIGSVDSALTLLEVNASGVEQKKTDHPQEIVNKLHKLLSEKEQLSDGMAELIDENDWYAKWGDVKKSDLDLMAKKGYFLKLFEADKSILKKLPTDQLIITVSEDKNSVLLALLSENEDNTLLTLKPEIVPVKESAVVAQELKEHQEKLAAIIQEIGGLAVYHDQVKALQEDLVHQLEFAQVKHGMGSIESITYLQGYCPVDKIDALKDAADKSGWGYMIEEPGEEDNPPTKLQNKKWIEMIQPVFDFLGIVPGYREYDISQYFLIFFTFYFAMIIGDAGYGMLFLLGAIFARTKVKKGTEVPQALKLLFTLSITTLVWGTITGNWFGSETIAGFPIVKSLTIPKISAFPKVFDDPNLTDAVTQNRVMLICFIIAITQLSLANIMNFLKEFPKLKSFSHLGWLSLMGGLFYLVLQLVLSMAFPPFAKIMIIVGFALIFIFGGQEEGKSFAKGLLGGLGGAFTTFLDSISSFSNIISYIRLFAVGLASVAIAQSFNGIAGSMPGFLAYTAGILVLLIGHGLNIVMGLLSVIVHGIRLNVLEFSGQLGIEWSGYKYKPFKDKK